MLKVNSRSAEKNTNKIWTNTDSANAVRFRVSEPWIATKQNVLKFQNHGQRHSSKNYGIRTKDSNRAVTVRVSNPWMAT